MKKQNKVRLTSILISLCLSLTGCNSKESIINSKYQNETLEETVESSEIMPESTEEPSTIKSIYLEQLNSINPEFNYEEYYYDMDYLDKLLEENEKIEECSYVFDGNIGSVVDQIVKNTNEFVRENGEYTSPFVRSTSYRSAITKCLRDIATNCNNDLNSDFHQISNMAIVLGNENYFNQENDNLLYTAIYENDMNVIVVNQKLLESIIEYNKFSESSFVYYIISHEVNHARQNVCPCNEDYRYSNFNYSLDGYSFLMESSSESDLYNMRDMEDILLQFSYQNERKNEGELFLLSILNHDDSSQYYNAIFDIDYEKFFNFFNLTTDEERLYLLRIIESIDAKYCRNNIPYSIFDDVSKATYNELIGKIGFTYKELLFKRCLINLINYTEDNPDFSLQDNLVILNIIKSYLIDETYTYDENDEIISRIYDIDTISNMMNMEKIYVSYLVTKYNTSEDSIREYESVEIKVLIEAIMAIADEDDNNYGVYTSYAHELVSKFPMIIPILQANDDYSYNTYEERILKIND